MFWGRYGAFMSRQQWGSE